jgi:hypothetical protein
MFYTIGPWCPFKINWPFLTTSRAVEAELAKEQEIKHRALAELEEKKALISDLEEKEARGACYNTFLPVIYGFS